MLNPNACVNSSWNPDNCVVNADKTVRGFIDFEQAFVGTATLFLGTLIDHINILNWPQVKTALLQSGVDALPGHGHANARQRFSVSGVRLRPQPTPPIFLKHAFVPRLHASTTRSRGDSFRPALVRCRTASSMAPVHSFILTAFLGICRVMINTISLPRLAPEWRGGFEPGCKKIL